MRFRYYCSKLGITPLRGEHRVVPLPELPRYGSPPRARGARQQRPQGGPARDHPRVRGEHRSSSGYTCESRGITPACAGSTCTPSATAPATAGSPPRARGAAIRPASRREVRDHPRVRGEHELGRRGCSERSAGSPPRARGALPPSVARRPRPAGSPPRARGAPPSPGAAVGLPGSPPRARGARDRVRDSRRSTAGSPPRARGARRSSRTSRRGSARITPACAGSTPADGRRAPSGGITPACAGSTS